MRYADQFDCGIKENHSYKTATEMRSELHIRDPSTRPNYYLNKKRRSWFHILRVPFLFCFYIYFIYVCVCVCVCVYIRRVFFQR